MTYTQIVMYVSTKPDKFCPREECHDTCVARGAASFVWTKPEVAGNSKICYCKVGKDMCTNQNKGLMNDRYEDHLEGQS